MVIFFLTNEFPTLKKLASFISKFDSLDLEEFHEIKWIFQKLNTFVEEDENQRLCGIEIGYEDFERIASLKKELNLFVKNINIDDKSAIYDVILSYIDMEADILEWFEEDGISKMPPDFIRENSIVFYKNKKYLVVETNLVEQQAYLKLISDKTKRDCFTTIPKDLQENPQNEIAKIKKEIKLLEDKLDKKKN